MSNFTSNSKKRKNSFSSPKTTNKKNFEKNNKVGNEIDSKIINPFSTEVTFGKANIEGNEYEISFTCNEEESKFSNNTNEKILDFLERKEFIYYNYDNFSKCETDNFSIDKTKKKSVENKRNIYKNKVKTYFNNINIWKILFLLLVEFFIVFLIVINEYEKMKIRVIDSIKSNLDFKFIYGNITELSNKSLN